MPEKNPKFDPIIRFLTVVWSLVWFSVPASIPWLALGVFVLSMIFITEFSLKALLQFLWRLKYVVLVVGAFYFLYFRTLAIDPYLILFFQLIGFWTGLSLLFAEQSYEEFSDSLERIHFPKAVARAIGTTLGILERYKIEMSQLIKYQELRGYKIESRHPLKSAKTLHRVFIPIFSLAILRSKVVAAALSSKNWHPEVRRTPFREFRFQLRDWIVFSVLTVLAVCRMLTCVGVIILEGFLL